MGWEGTGFVKKSQLIRDLTKPVTLDSGRGRVAIAKAIRGATLWVVYEYAGSDGLGERFICACKDIARDGDGWGYKGETESMGPTEVTCPLSFLDLVPDPPNEFGREWRERVRAHHAKRVEGYVLYRDLRPGMRLEIPDAKGGPFLVLFAGSVESVYRYRQKTRYVVRILDESTDSEWRLPRKLTRGMKVLENTLAA